MQKIKILFVLAIALAGKLTYAQPAQAIKEYILKYKDLAIEELLDAARIRGWGRDAVLLGDLSPEIGAVDLVDQRGGVYAVVDNTPALVLSDEPGIV